MFWLITSLVWFACANWQSCTAEIVLKAWGFVGCWEWLKCAGYHQRRWGCGTKPWCWEFGELNFACMLACLCESCFISFWYQVEKYCTLSWLALFAGFFVFLSSSSCSSSPLFSSFCHFFLSVWSLFSSSSCLSLFLLVCWLTYYIWSSFSISIFSSVKKEIFSNLGVCVVR